MGAKISCEYKEIWDKLVQRCPLKVIKQINPNEAQDTQLESGGVFDRNEI